MFASTRARALLALASSICLAGSATADLLVYYTFDVDNGTVVDNTGILPNDGTLAGGGTYGTSREPSFGSAFYGNRAGDNDAYVQTGYDGTTLGMGAGGVYTAMAWINWAGEEGQVDHMVFGQEDGPGNNAQLHHGIRDDSAPLNIHFGGWGGDQDIGDAGAVAANEWTHVTWQYDGTNKNVFVNGLQTSNVIGNNITNPALPVIVGGHGRDAADPAGQSFNGAIDEVRVYDEVLTEAQIQAAMIPALDTDGDGLSNDQENLMYNTDPNNPDTDGDGIGDGLEVANMLDPNSDTGDDGAMGDPDGDLVSNTDELLVHGTDPQEPDTDGDGLDDGVEINTHMSDPTDVDTDGDTLEDGAEINTHNTDPTLADTDGDLFDDNVEIDANTNPTDPNEFPAVVLPQPILYYPFDIDDGTVVQNAGSLMTPGTLTGGATYGASVDASFGTAFYGNRAGDNDAHVAVGFDGNTLSMGAGASYTAMAWINWAGSSGDDDHMVFGQDDGGVMDNVAQLHHGIRDDSAANIHFGGWGGTQDIADAGTVPPDEWTHVAWQFDQAGAGDAVVYVNGVEVTRADKNVITTPELNLVVGGHSRDTAAVQSFNGALDEVRIYDVALTAAQIRLAMVPDAPGGQGIQITNILFDDVNEMLTLTFTSTPSRTYSVFWTPDLEPGSETELDDGLPAHATDPTTTFTIPVPVPDINPSGEIPDDVFIYIVQNPL